MTSNQSPDSDQRIDEGIVRVPFDPARGAYNLPRSHHGDQVAPLTPAGRPYALRWTDPNRSELVYAEAAEDLLSYWITSYRTADGSGRALLRAQHAVQLRSALAAELLVDAQENGVPVTAEQEAVLLADLDQLPDLDRWDSPVPLVLLEGMYRPYTDRIPPISGIDGDVREPSNIIWLRNAHPTEYLQSLARAGAIQLDISHDV